VKTKLEKLIAREKKHLLEKAALFEVAISKHVTDNREKIDINYSDLSSRIVAVSSKFRQ
jgi:hypothetical protein